MPELLNNKPQPPVYTCQKCGSVLFEPVYFLLEMSRIMYPQLSQDTLQPQQTLRCMTCKTIPKLMDPFQEQDNTVNIIT